MKETTKNLNSSSKTVNSNQNSGTLVKNVEKKSMRCPDYENELTYTEEAWNYMNDIEETDLENI